MTERRHPLRIRLWYRAHDAAEALWHWIYYAKIQPWEKANPRVVIPPKYYHYDTIQATPEEKARGITEKRLYVSR